MAAAHPSLSDLEFRALLPEHASALHSLLNRVVAEGKYLASQTAFALPVVEQFLYQNCLSANPQFALWRGAELQGWCDAVRSVAKSQLARLGMGLAADYRGQGLGKQMLKLLQQHCLTLDIEQLELQVFADNDAAIGLYLNCGFEVVGCRQKPMLRSGKSVDVVIMSWSLG